MPCLYFTNLNAFAQGTIVHHRRESSAAECPKQCPLGGRWWDSPAFFPFVSGLINLASGDYYALWAIRPLRKKIRKGSRRYWPAPRNWVRAQDTEIGPVWRLVHVRWCRGGRKRQGKRKQHHGCETYRFLLLILNTSFCSSCTKRKNSLIWALIDISSILIRSTLAGYYYTFFLQFCHDVINCYWD